MLIQHRAPLIKPTGGPVLRVRRDHPLAQELRACIILGGTAGTGIDLVSGVVLTTGGTPVPAVGEDGPLVDLNATSYLSLAHDASLNITDNFSLGWRGRRNSATDDIIISKLNYGAGAGGEYTPWDFQVVPGGNMYFVRSRQGAYQFRAWMGSASFIPTGRIISASITQGAAIEVAPRFFVDGVEDATPTNMYGGAATGVAYTNTDPVIINGYKGTSNLADASHSLFLIAATTWDTAQNVLFGTDPYGILEDAPLYHHSIGSTSSASASTGVLTATLANATLSAAGTLALRGTTTATLGAATLASTGAVALTGTSTATLAAATLSATGTLTISGAASATLAAITGVAAGTVALTGALSVTLDAATLAADGTSASVVTGTLAVTLDAATLAAASTLVLRGTTTTTLANATLAGTGTLSLRATSSVTLGNVTLSATGTNGNVVNAIVLVWNGVRI